MTFVFQVWGTLWNTGISESSFENIASIAADVPKAAERLSPASPHDGVPRPALRVGVRLSLWRVPGHSCTGNLRK